MIITIQLTKAIGAPDTALIAEIEEFSAAKLKIAYQNDAKAILDFMLNVLPSGTVDRLVGMLPEAVKTRLIRPLVLEEVTKNDQTLVL